MRTPQQTKFYQAQVTLLLVFCLLFSILFAQLLGLTHGIAHAPLDGAAQGVSTGSRAAGNLLHDTTTSCAAFDEACVGASLHTPTYFPPLLPGVAVLSLWIAFASWKQPFQRLFSSRAPPA